jgi:hypothetical protein
MGIWMVTLGHVRELDVERTVGERRAAERLLAPQDRHVPKRVPQHRDRERDREQQEDGPERHGDPRRPDVARDQVGATGLADRHRERDDERGDDEATELIRLR